MINLTAQFPDTFQVTVTVERSGGTDSRGNPTPGTSHEVDDCLVTTQSSDEEARTALPDTSAYVYAPAGSDFAPKDIVVVPEGARLWPWGRFIVNGDPDFGPLGVRVQLRRV